MKKKALVGVAFLVTVVAAGACYAQRPALMVNIPFAFCVENKTLPAGEYRIESLPTGTGTIHVVRPIAGGAVLIVSTVAVNSKSGESKPELIFNRYGESYFLSQIWTGEGKGRQLFRSAQEKEVARRKAKVEVALVLHAQSARSI